VKSDYIKACLSAYYRFGKQFHYIATEAGRFNSDFLAVKDNVCTEVEIKVSKADLNNDFKKDKHRMYANAKSKYVPNYFFFAVPEELVEYAVAKCVDKPYGVLVVKKSAGKLLGRSSARDEEYLKNYILPTLRKNRDGFELVKVVTSRYSGLEITYTYYGKLDWQSRVKTVKRAKRLHDKVVDKQTVSNIMSRLSSEMSNFRIKEQNAKEIENDKQKSDKQEKDTEEVSKKSSDKKTKKRKRKTSKRVSAN
jgi:hypothetical protein